MLTVVTPADSQDLAALGDVKTALGITGTAEDTTLAPLISQASAAIATFCNRTLVQETVAEAFRRNRYGDSLMLARYPIASFTSIVENGATLATTDYEADLETGIVDRLRSDCPGCWSIGKTVVTYVAGYELEDMPPDVVQALLMLVAQYRSQSGRDPLLKSETTTDIETLEYFIPTDNGLPAPVEALLAGHRKTAGA